MDRAGDFYGLAAQQFLTATDTKPGPSHDSSLSKPCTELPLIQSEPLSAGNLCVVSNSLQSWGC